MNTINFIKHEESNKIETSKLKNIFTNESITQDDKTYQKLLLMENENFIGALYMTDLYLENQFPTIHISCFLLEDTYNLDDLSCILSNIVDYLFDYKWIGISISCAKNNKIGITLLKKLKFKKMVEENDDTELYFLDNRKVNYVYMLRCQNGNLYTGWTNNLVKRLQMHNSKKGAKYTKVFGPCVLVHYELYATREEAMKREYQIKHLTRKQKEELVNE